MDPVLGMEFAKKMLLFAYQCDSDMGAAQGILSDDILSPPCLGSALPESAEMY